MSLLARRNLFHDKVRLVVTLTGVVFAVVLIIVEMGLFFGFTQTTSRLIDHSGADLWVVSPGTPYFDMSAPLNESKLYRVKTVPGVAEAISYIVHGTRWSRPDGGAQAVQVIGFDPSADMGKPWNIVEGSIDAVKAPDSVIVDEFYKRRLGVAKVGDVAEIEGHRVRIAGFTRRVLSFAPSPFVFTTTENAHEYLPLRNDQEMFVLVKTEPGADLEGVRRNILARVKNVEVLSTLEFSRRTRIYWTFTTGAGLAILLAAVLGLVVGFVVVAQTIYATTMDHIKEFGTLKAVGAPNSYIYKVILTQAVISAVLGYTFGMILSMVVIHYAGLQGAPVQMDLWLLVATFILTLVMCAGAALISINKVTRLDPAMVFKG